MYVNDSTSSMGNLDLSNQVPLAKEISTSCGLARPTYTAFWHLNALPTQVTRPAPCARVLQIDISNLQFGHCFLEDNNPTSWHHWIEVSLSTSTKLLNRLKDQSLNNAGLGMGPTRSWLAIVNTTHNNSHNHTNKVTQTQKQTQKTDTDIHVR